MKNKSEHEAVAVLAQDREQWRESPKRDTEVVRTVTLCESRKEN